MKKVIVSLVLVVALLGSVALAQGVAWERDGAVTEELKKPCVTLDPWQPTNLSPEVLELVWPGHGQTLADLETTWCINALFCASVAQIESGKQNKWSNFFGIKGGRGQLRNANGFRIWEDDYKGILGFGEYLRTSGFYKAGSSIEQIGVTYCNIYWAGPVYAEMSHLIKLVGDEIF